MKSGIYQIKNLVNGRVYIGSSSNISKRWRNHKSQLKNNKHINRHLQSSYNKHGEQNFEFTIVVYCEPSLFVVQEQRFIDENFPNVYNQRKVAESNLGMKHGPHTEEAKEKMRAANLGNTYGAGNRGKTRTEETKEKIRAGNRGKTLSEETKEKLRAVNLGKTLSKETKEKIRVGKLGKTPGEETKEKMRAAKLGKTHSDETKEKIRAGNLGKTLSEETKEKIRAGNRVYSEEKILELYALLKLHQLKTVVEVTGINASTLSNIKYGLRYKQYYHLYNS